ncbi:MAG: glycerophosphodiester phosphodiesterase, partial [Planctomycetales bacterium]|nr:glycerophosphodiester phosphodiesterase [Planctomycetales bacterium]
LALHMRWLLAFPAVVLDGQGARAALAGSWKLSRGSLTTIAAAVGGWAVGTALLGALAALALELISRFAIGLAGERLALLAPTVALVLIANAVVATAVSIVAGASHAMLVGRLYQGARMGAGLPLAASLPSPVAAAAGPVWFARRWVWIAACCALFAATALGGVVLVESLGVADDVAVTAHRGSSRRAPENSLAAIRLAIEDGADFAEIDVQETADGQIVVLHDADLMRVAGLNRNIWDVTVAELADLDAGSWFDPKFADERIPTLAQAVAAARGKIKLNIELKYNGHDERLAERVVEVLNEHDFVDQCVITSLHLDGALAAKKLEPRLQVGAITAVSIGRAAGLDVDFLSVADRQATRAFIAAAHGGGKTVHVWTVNDEASMNRMIDRGADNLITDEPALARRLLDERSRLSNSQRLLLKLRTWLEG